MNNYNLILKIALITLPFRHYRFVKCDYYYEYCVGNITYKDFIYAMFNIINNEFYIKDLDEFILILESIFPKKYGNKYDNLYYSIYNIKENDFIWEFYFGLLDQLGKSLLLIK